MSTPSSPFRTHFLTVVALAVAAACSDPASTSPEAPGLLAARGGGGGDPVVQSVVPDSATQDTTLDITVSGKNFDDGSVVELGQGGIASPKIQTNSTTFLNPRKLKANITVALDADIGLYDVIVTSFRGRRGIGAEMVDIKVKGGPSVSLATFILPDTLSNPEGVPNTSPPGLYSDDAAFENEPLEQALIVDCPRTFVLVRSSTDPAWTIAAGDEIHCSGADGFSRLDHKLGAQALCASGGGCPIEQHGHELKAGSNFAPDLNYYFRVSTGKGKGKFAQYNVVWTNATFQSSGSDVDGNPCSWRLLATKAEFWEQLSIKDDVVQVGVKEDMALDVRVDSQAEGC